MKSFKRMRRFVCFLLTCCLLLSTVTHNVAAGGNSPGDVPFGANAVRTDVFKCCFDGIVTSDSPTEFFAQIAHLNYFTVTVSFEIHAFYPTGTLVGNTLLEVPRGSTLTADQIPIPVPTPLGPPLPQSGTSFIHWTSSQHPGEFILHSNEFRDGLTDLVITQDTIFTAHFAKYFYTPGSSEVTVIFETPSEMVQLQQFLLNNPGVRVPPNYLRERALIGHTNFEEQLTSFLEAQPYAVVEITFASTWHHNFVRIIVPFHLIDELNTWPEVSKAGHLSLPGGWTSVPFQFEGNGGMPQFQEFVVYHYVPEGVIYASIFAQVDEPTREGYTFIGWFTACEGGVQVLPEDEVGNYAWRQLHAQWEPVTVTGCEGIPITLLWNDGSTGLDNIFYVIIVRDGIVESVPEEPRREGFIFAGLAKDAEGNYPIPHDMPWESLVGIPYVYIQWEQEPEITLTFRSNIGYPALQTVTVTVGTPFAEVLAQIETPTSKEPWHQFDGWYPAINLHSVVDCCTPLYFDAVWWWITSYEPLFFEGNGGTPEWQGVMFSGFTPDDTPLDFLFNQVKAPTREGYEFIGWFTAPEGGIQLFPTDTVGDARRAWHTLFAQWEPVAVETVTVTFAVFEHGGGMLVGNTSAEVLRGGTLTAEQIPTPVGIPHYCSVHGYDGDCSVAPIFAYWVNEQMYLFSHDDLTNVVITEAITFTALFEGVLSNHQMTLLWNDGKVGEDNVFARISERDIWNGTITELPAPPSPAPYLFFAGWATDKYGLNPFVLQIPQGCIYLYAQWGIISATEIIEFCGNGGTPEMQVRLFSGFTPDYVSLEFLFDQIEIPTRESGGSFWAHYEFIGWFTAPEGGRKIFPTDTVGDIRQVDNRLFAQWERMIIPVMYLVTFELCEDSANYGLGTLVGDTEVIVHPLNTLDRSQIPTPVAADISDCCHFAMFMYWTSPQFPGKFFGNDDLLNLVIVDNTTFIAVFGFAEGHHSVRLMYNDGSSRAFYAFASQMPVPSLAPPNREGFVFTGWATDPQGNNPFELIEGMVIGGSCKNLYAQWEQECPRPLFRVIFEVSCEMDSTLLGETTVYVTTPGSTLTAEQIPTPVASPANTGFGGVMFIYWTSSQHPGHHQDLTILAITEDTTFTAVFYPVTGCEGIPITLLWNDGSDNVFHTVVVRAGVVESLPEEPHREGYIFVGWAKDAAGNYPINSPVPWSSLGIATVYAQWERMPETVTFTFRSNIGEHALQTVTATVGSPFAEVLAQIETPTSEQPWYEFDRWYPVINLNSVVDCCTPLYFDAKWLTIMSDAALFFEGNGGTPEQQGIMFSGWTPDDMPIDWLFAQVAQPTRAGYTFLGWFSRPEGGIQLLSTNNIGDVRREAVAGDTLFAQWEAVSQAPAPPAPPTLPPAPPSSSPPPHVPLLSPARRQTQQTEAVEAPVYAIHYDESGGDLDAPPLTTLPVPEQSATTLIFTSNSERYFYRGRWHAGIGTPFIDPATDRMMVPIRTIAEAIDVAVDWCDDTRAAVIYLPDGKLLLPIDEPLPNGMGTPVIVEDRVFVPLRFIMYTLGADVEWDSENNTAVITMQ